MYVCLLTRARKTALIGASRAAIYSPIGILLDILMII